MTSFPQKLGEFFRIADFYFIPFHFSCDWAWTSMVQSTSEAWVISGNINMLYVYNVKTKDRNYHKSCKSLKL